MNLTQKKLFNTRVFTLNKDSLNIKSRDLTSSEELNIPYEEIDTSKIIKQKQTDNIMLIITIIFGGFLIINLLNPANYKDDGLFPVAIFLFLVTLVSGLITYIKSSNLILIPTVNNGHLKFYRSNPSQEKTDKFIAKLTDKIKLFLRSKYGTIDLDMPTEPQLLNISWLKDREVITMEEFEKLKTKIINKRNGENPVGFNK